MAVAEQETVMVVEGDAAPPRVVDLGMGRAAIFSTRCPGKTGPNEDAIAVFPRDERSGVIVVADGMGGHSGGENASRLAVQAVGRALERPTENGGALRSAILDALEQANEDVLALGIGAATTLAAVEISGNTLRPYHVGDAEILVVGQRGKIKLQTVSHSPVGYAVEAGLLDEREAMHHDERHVISNMIGARDMRIEVGSPRELARLDTVLVASDGLFDNLDPAEIADVIRTKPLDVVTARLAELATSRMTEPTPGHPSKPDDLTFAVFRLDR
jgi:serine/threonine protein phosphatase PrpC